jgi:hypothetical protein
MDNDDWIKIPSQKFPSNTRLENSQFYPLQSIRCPPFFFLFGYLSPSKMLLRNCTQLTGSWKPSRIAPTDGRRSNDQRVHMDTVCQLAVDCNLAQNQGRKMAATTLTP